LKRARSERGTAFYDPARRDMEKVAWDTPPEDKIEKSENDLTGKTFLVKGDHKAALGREDMGGHLIIQSFRKYFPPSLLVPCRRGKTRGSKGNAGSIG